MNEINWADVAKKYNLTSEQIQKQIFIAACVMADMQIDSAKNGEDAMVFTCEQEQYNLELTVIRKN